TDSELINRVDLREVMTVTIDGESARDFDDAVSLEELPNGRLRLGIHIADVSHYVREGSPLDEAAFERGTSVYFPERAIPMLPEMHELTTVLIKKREDRGAIDFDLPEAELLFNDEGQIGGIVRSERNIAHRLIEEFMLLANETVARHLESLNVPLLYRIHEEPNIEKVEEFAEIAASFGHKFSMHGPIPQRGLQRLSREIRGRPEERLLSYLMLRSMQRARYTPNNAGHYGLAMKTYTHFTSPIRRYPDLIVHRILREVIDRGREQD